MGSGLAILSKFPIIEQSYFRYALSGRPLKVFHGDFYVGKGCGSVCINHPEVGLIDVYTTHVSLPFFKWSALNVLTALTQSLIYQLHAGYGRRKEYEGHRITEAWELTKLFRSSAASGRHVIAVRHTLIRQEHTKKNYLIFIFQLAWRLQRYPIKLSISIDNGSWENERFMARSEWAQDTFQP